VRIGPVYDQAQQRAQEQSEKITHVIERKLAHYVADDPVRELYDTCMDDFLQVHARREAWEGATQIPATPATLPKEILVPWRGALAQVRLLREQYRRRGVEPPAVPEGMQWIDERRIELRTTEDGNVFWVQTDAPEGSPFA
jgi:hypothetical protein